MGTDWEMNTQNVVAALARLDRMGGRALVGDVVAAFRRHGPARAREAREACAGGDADRLARSVHSLRSSAGQLGADDLAALCARLEILGGAGAVAEAFPLTSRLMADVDELLRDLESRAGEAMEEDRRRRVVGVVEDNDDTRLILRKILEPYYEVDECGDGHAALDRFTRRPPDAILLDISLPGMDGPAVLAGLRAHPALRTVPVAALTAHAMAGDREAFLARGFDEYVSKPILDEEDLLRVVRHLLERTGER